MHPKYRDLLNLSHHVSPTRPQMSHHDRAAQFAPFAALTGHDAAIQETAQEVLLPEQLAEAQFLEHLRRLEDPGYESQF